jgi:dTDP-4-amino-4,6-dideoxygalactose transaminase
MDLHSQYLSLKDEIKAAVLQVFDSGRYIIGPNVTALEQEVAEYCGTDFAVGVGNGTDALVLSLDAFGVGPGDEVITTSYSFFATAEAISRVGAKPVFVDVDADTYNIDVSQIEEKITERTKAILPVHLFGQLALMDKITEIAGRHSLVVIEDACQAIGASYKGRKAGSWGDAGCFSFFPSKNLGGYGDGGMITTNNEDLAARLRMLRAHGSRKKYYNEIIGYNSRLDEVQAAILRVKLRCLNGWNQARRDKAEVYNNLLKNTGLTLPQVVSDAVHIYHLYIVGHPQREKIIEALNREGISTGIYYPIPLHRLEVYNRAAVEPPLPVVEQASLETFAIPMFPEITHDQQSYVAEKLDAIMASL